MLERVRSIAVALSVTAALMVAGCAAPATSAPTPAPAPGVPGAATPRPGLEKQPDGTTVAFGWVVRMDIEGGFWTLADADPTAGASGATVVVLLPGKVADSEIAALADTYVRATGTIAEGASIRMAGPEMTVDAIQALAPNK